MKPFYVILAAVGAIGAIAVGYAIGRGTLGPPVSTPVQLEGLDEPAALIYAARGVTRGDEDARVTVVEFGDFQCPVCAVFAREVEPRIVSELVETGRAKFVVYDNPLVSIHANAFVSARAARCAEELGGFWEYRDALYRTQSEWSSLAEPADALEELAESVGLDAGPFRGCLRSGRHAELVSANLSLAERLGIFATPTIVVSVPGQDPRQVERMDFASILATVEEMVAADTVP
jgi:protein-disulfide isomerase